MVKFLDERTKGEEFYIACSVPKHLRFLKKRNDGKHVSCENIDNGKTEDVFYRAFTFDTKEECIMEMIRHIESQMKINREHLMSELMMYHYQSKVDKQHIKELRKLL